MAGLKGLTVNTAPEAEPHIYAEDDAAIFQSIFGEDGVSSIGQACKATVLSNNKVRIADGVVFVGGHFARIPYGEYVDCEIANGQSGKNRNDIIVAKFVTTGSGGIDTMTCEVKQGTAGTTAADPALTQNDIYKGGKIREFPLYRVKIEGLNITAVEQLFTVVPTNAELIKTAAELNGKSETKLSFVVGFDTIETNSIKRKSNLIEISIKALKNAVLQSTGSLGTVPEGFRPTHEVIVPAVGWTASGVPCSASISIGTDGVVGFRQSGSATRWLIFHTSYFI